MGFLYRLLTFYIIFLSSSSQISVASDSLRDNQVLAYGQTLVSPNQRFELAFFNLGRPEKDSTYLGLRYKISPRTIFWVANRNRPIPGPAGRLSLTPYGFKVSDNSSYVDVLSFVSTEALTNPVLTLLNNGNLVFIDESLGGGSEGYLWQSFDHVTDNLLPGMKLGWNLKAGFQTNMTSWVSDDDPSEGLYTFSMDSPETPQFVLSRGAAKVYRWGPWDGVKFSGGRAIKPNSVFTPSFYSSAEEVFYSYKGNDDSTLWRSVVTPQGSVQYLVWSESENDWKNQVTIQGDTCDNYGYCGPYGVCYEAPVCKCLKGFQMKSPGEGKNTLLLSGCERKRNLSCGNGDGFIKYGALKLPDKSYLAATRGLRNLKECERECLKSCSCTAYAWFHIHKKGGNCVLWSGDLMDMKNLQEEGSDLYIRMSKQELSMIFASSH